MNLEFEFGYELESRLGISAGLFIRCPHGYYAPMRGKVLAMIMFGSGGAVQTSFVLPSPMAMMLRLHFAVVRWVIDNQISYFYPL